MAPLLVTLPAWSVKLPAAIVMTLVASVMLAVGVRVAVQVMLSAEKTLVNVPLAMVRSVLSKLITGSLKVKVTVEVSPAISEVSATTIELMVGLVESIVNSLVV